MTWPSENTRAHKVGELEDEPQAGLALKRQSARRGWNACLSSDCTLRPTLRLFIVAFLVFLTQSPSYIFCHLLVVQRDSTNGGCRHRELYYYVLLRHTPAWRAMISRFQNSFFLQIFNEMFIIRVKKHYFLLLHFGIGRVLFKRQVFLLLKVQHSYVAIQISTVYTFSFYHFRFETSF